MVLAAATLGLIAIAGPVADRIWMKRHEGALEIYRARAARAAGPLREQRAKLAADPFFREVRPDNDASGYFQSLGLVWGAHCGASRLELDTTLKRELSSLGVEWATNFQHGLRPLPSTAWMAELHSYGYWEFDSRNTPSSECRDGKGLRLWHVDAVGWAKLRMLEGLESGRPAEAARDVRQLAWLLYSTEDLLATTTAGSLLSVERQAFDSYLAHGGAAVGWEPMTTEQITLLRRVIRATFALANYTTPLEVLDADVRPSADGIGVCAALTSMVEEWDDLRPVRGGELLPVYRWLESQLAQPGPCRLTRARLMLAGFASWDKTSAYYHGRSDQPTSVERAAEISLLSAPLRERARSMLLVAIIPSIDALRGFDPELPP